MLLAELDHLLQAEGLVVLTGLGGVGETQLALAWLRTHRNAFEVVWWVRAEREATLTVDLAALADHKRLCDQTTSLPDKLAATRRWLDETHRWLLVFDNATDAAFLEPYLPTGGGGNKVLVTETAETLELDHKTATLVLNQAAGYLWGRAELKPAAALLERTLTIREAHLGPDHPDTAISLNNLANVLYDQDDLEQARRLHGARPGYIRGPPGPWPPRHRQQPQQRRSRSARPGRPGRRPRPV